MEQFKKFEQRVINWEVKEAESLVMCMLESANKVQTRQVVNYSDFMRTHILKAIQDKMKTVIKYNHAVTMTGNEILITIQDPEWSIKVIENRRIKAQERLDNVCGYIEREFLTLLEEGKETILWVSRNNALEDLEKDIPSELLKRGIVATYEDSWQPADKHLVPRRVLRLSMER